VTRPYVIVLALCRGTELYRLLFITMRLLILTYARSEKYQILPARIMPWEQSDAVNRSTFAEDVRNYLDHGIQDANEGICEEIMKKDIMGMFIDLFFISCKHG